MRHWDPGCCHAHHQLNVEDLHAALKHLCNDIDRLCWTAWYQRSFVLSLEDATHYYTSNIGPIEDLLPQPSRANKREHNSQTQPQPQARPCSQLQLELPPQLARATQLPATPQQQPKDFKKHFQRNAYNKLPHSESYSPIPP